MVGGIVEAASVDAGEGEVEAPLVVGDAQDKCFLAGADGTEAVEELLV